MISTQHQIVSRKLLERARVLALLLPMVLQLKAMRGRIALPKAARAESLKVCVYFITCLDVREFTLLKPMP